MKIVGAQKSYRAAKALDIDMFEVERGKIYAIIGSNGSGKTTLLRALAGQIALDSGSVVLEPGANIGYAPQKSHAFYGTVERNVLLGASGKRSPQGASEFAQTAKLAPDRTAGSALAHRADVVADETAAGAFDAWGGSDEHRMEALLKYLSIDALAQAKAKRLSGGETARMVLARLLMGDYTYLLLDEPTAALDVMSTLSAERLIASYRDAFGAGVVIVTHSVKQAERLSDEILFMSGGRIVETGPTRDVIAHPQTKELRRFFEIAGA